MNYFTNKVMGGGDVQSSEVSSINFLATQIKRISLVSAAVVLAAMNIAQANTTKSSETMKIVSVNSAVKAVIGGTVTDDKGTALPGVLVKVKGTSVETSTDAQGRFSINAPDNSTLVFSSIGFATQEIAASGRTSITVKLVESNENLSEVVVTALGIERSSKSLTYNTTTISSEELTAVKNPNVLNNLAGKAAGVFVTQGAGGPGSSPRIIMRGNKSMNGNNQPTYVVDGIPMGFSDFNSEDIESLTVLQGATAAALYGGGAANGVILITTKKGKANTTSVDFVSTSTFDRPAVLPDLQTSYGAGTGGVASTVAINDSWGPKITNGEEDHVKNYFNTGTNYINSLSISGGTGAQRLYFSYANTNSEAMVPNYGYDRHNVNIKGNTSIFNNKVAISGGVNFVKTDVANANSSSWTKSPMFGLYLFPMGVNFDQYRANGGAVFNTTRGFYTQNWPYIKNEHSSNQNPYWVQYHQTSDDMSEKTIYNAGAKYDIKSWLNIAYRFTFTTNNGEGETRNEASSDPIDVGNNGGYSKNSSGSNSWYSDLLLNANHNLTKNLTLNATAGYVFGSSFSRNLSDGTTGSSTTLAYPNYFSVNALYGSFNASESRSQSASQAVLGTTGFAWKDMVFLDLTGRNDWSSTTRESYFYPSAGLAYILTQTIGTNDILSFAKIRGSYSQTGNGLGTGAAEFNPFLSVSSTPTTASPYRSVNGTPSTLPFFSGTDTINLKPERTKSFEVGTELRFFKDKLNLSVTYYNGETVDQVFTIAAPSGSGASSFYLNGGNIQNWGWEATAGYNAKLGAVKWTSGLNFSSNKNKIKSLSTLLTSARFDLQTGNRLTNLYLIRPGSALLGGREFSRYHDLYGKTYVRDASGNPTYNATTGLPILSPAADQYVGNANPDFLLNMSNQFSYKAFTMSFLVDGRFGGLTSSSTQQWLDYKGLSQRSGDARDAGGVMVNGKLISPELYYGYISAKADAGALADAYLYSTTNIRMRELAIGYKLPQFTKAVKNLTLTAIGRNLFFFTKKAPFDPETALGTANGSQGFESFQIPTARSFGLTLRAGL